MQPLVRPGGRLLFGEAFWERPATAELVNQLGVEHSADLAGMVDAAVEVGFRPLGIGSATRAEWEEFESGFLADWEEWLVGNAAHPSAADIRAASARHRNTWLRGNRDVLGFGYLILGRPR